MILSCFSFAFGQGFTIKAFDVKIKIDKDGYADVHEIINVYFTESKHGIYRDIPYKYILQGKDYTTPITNIKVANQKSEIKSTGTAKSIRIGNPSRYVTGPETYDISYRVKGPFITNDTSDEFYWNITGNYWQAPIEKVNFDIEFPDDVAIPYSDLKLFTGKVGSKTDSGYIQQNGRHITGQNIETLSPNQGLTIAVKLPLAYINHKNVANVNNSTLDDLVEDAKLQWPLATLPAILISLFVGFWNKLRRRYIPPTLKEKMPYPPDNMNPAEVGAFYDQVVNDRDVISLLPYWAAQGFIRMEYDQHTQDTYLTQLNELSGNRANYEYTLFRNLFANRSSVALSELKDHFHSTHSLVKSMIRREIIEQELYDGEYSYWFKSWRGWLAVVLFIPLAILSFVMSYWFAGVFFVLGFIIGLILLLQPRVMSQKGYLIHLHLKSFYQFLKGNDPHDFETQIKEDPNYFDKVYPYAVAFALDKSFIQKIKTFRPQAPIWYGYYGIPMMMGGRNHSMEDFGREFEPKEITSAFNSVPAPDPGSGGSGGGGGFSGGGFGGGGGGSW